MALHKGNLLYCEATISQIEEKWTGSQVKLDFLAWTDTNWRTSPSNRLVEGGIFVVSIASSMSKLLMFDASQSRPWIYWAQIPHTEFLILRPTGLHATKIRYRIPTGLDDKWWLLRGDYNLIYWLCDKKWNTSVILMRRLCLALNICELQVGPASKLHVHLDNEPWILSLIRLHTFLLIRMRVDLQSPHASCPCFSCIWLLEI